MAIALNYNCQFPLSCDMKWPSFTEYERYRANVELNNENVTIFHSYLFMFMVKSYCKNYSTKYVIFVGPIFKLKLMKYVLLEVN